MRKILIIAIVTCTIVSCHKSNSENPIANTIIGKWYYTEQYQSSGPPGQWYPVNPPNQFISFEPNGVFATSTTLFSGVTRYQLMDSSRVKFIIPNFYLGYKLYQYKIDTVARTLTLSPLTFICIEGCASRFKRK